LTGLYPAGKARVFGRLVVGYSRWRARLLFANGLYRQLVALANAGQATWRLTDAQKAHEYVIDPGVVSAKPVVPVA
jgi:hypothetical protein